MFDEFVFELFGTLQLLYAHWDVMFFWFLTLCLFIAYCGGTDALMIRWHKAQIRGWPSFEYLRISAVDLNFSTNEYPSPILREHVK